MSNIGDLGPKETFRGTVLQRPVAQSIPGGFSDASGRRCSTKFNDDRRDKFEKSQYRVTNGAKYIESFWQCGDLTVWVSDDVAKNWTSPRRKTRGGQARYSDFAIEMCLNLRVVF
ncbi:transposase [Ruegeria hyattellae]|uniref:transposase n=1 Tax=Ruegeria hyattellae TaxID=3233337 RepID=UPI00355AEE2F